MLHPSKQMLLSSHLNQLTHLKETLDALGGGHDGSREDAREHAGSQDLQLGQLLAAFAPN